MTKLLIGKFTLALVLEKYEETLKIRFDFTKIIIKLTQINKIYNKKNKRMKNPKLNQPYHNEIRP